MLPPHPAAAGGGDGWVADQAAPMTSSGRMAGLQLFRTRRPWLATNALAWISFNVLAAVIYLHFASKTWIEPELRGEGVGREGDAVVWFGTAFPIALSCFLADIVMLVLAIRIGARTKQWSPLIVARGIGLGWAGAMTIDLARRF